MTKRKKDVDEALVLAAHDMLRRTGARQVQTRYQDDEEPVAWVALGEWAVEGGSTWLIGAGFTPAAALHKLVEEAIDGGQCARCRRPTMVLDERDSELTAGQFCAVVFDRTPPARFNRDCEVDGRG